MPRIPIVVFAQAPPPEHGQSRMVQRTIDALRSDSECFEVHHINARFSETLEEVGEGSLGKLWLTFRYLIQAIRVRTRLHDPLLMYVPGPAEWAPILRDWILLAVLRMVYRRVVFHWHAIGQGEWAHDSDRLRLVGPTWLDRFARAISRLVLNRPYASISVSEHPCKDSHACGSIYHLCVPNGIADPCPAYEQDIKPALVAADDNQASSTRPCFRILFLSHGTIEKGLLDAVEALRLLLVASNSQWRFAITFAGGVSHVLDVRFDREIEDLIETGGERVDVTILGYVTGDEKRRCYMEHNIFLAPSRWESFGLTVLEAMAYGMRVVAAASDGVTGVLPPGYPYLAPVANPQGLAGKLHECCTNIIEVSDPGLGAALRERFLRHFQLEFFSNQIITAFRGLGNNAAKVPCRDTPPGSQGAWDEDEHANDPPPSDQAYALTSRREIPAGSSTIHHPPSTISISVYLADQNPGYDRSFGISRMTEVVLKTLLKSGRVTLETISSKTSQQAPAGTLTTHVLPWSTRRKWMRLLTDHLHPLFHNRSEPPDVYYFPKGYLPWWRYSCRPSVVTIHDTIIQYDEDHYPQWRKRHEYAYWAQMLKHTLRHADYILTVSESSKRQIRTFMHRHNIPRNNITVTYEPCVYERLPQPENPVKENYVIHLASREPHKRTAHLIRWWHGAEAAGRQLPTLHLIGSVPPEVEALLASAHTIVKRPFLDDAALQAAYLRARALILPSEIEGFGLPALEAYYLGTPVCYVKGTSVEEVLSAVTDKGSFSLDSEESMFTALGEVMAMSAEEVRACGLELRDTYAAEKVAMRMLSVFSDLKN
jgi:glycosyltransferase involved in cell wall biosynthesis